MALTLKRVSSYVPSAQEDLLRLLLAFWPSQSTMKVGLLSSFNPSARKRKRINGIYEERHRLCMPHTTVCLLQLLTQKQNASYETE